MLSDKTRMWLLDKAPDFVLIDIGELESQTNGHLFSKQRVSESSEKKG